MAKYIDIESLVVGYSGHTPDDEFSKGVDFVLDLLDSKPPADVKPVVRGRWEPRDLTYGRSQYFCSVCGMKVDMATAMGVPLYRYCPYCGADNRRINKCHIEMSKSIKIE